MRRLLLATAVLVACTEPELLERPAPPPEPPALDRPWVAPDLMPPPDGTRFAMRELRVTWQGAEGAPASVTRSEAEARVRARELELALGAGQDFATLARSSSDAPTAPRGGLVGTFSAGTYALEVEAAVASVAPGELAPLVRTRAGYHVLRREAVEEVILRWVTVAGAAARADAVAAAWRAGTEPDAVRGPFTLGRDQWAPGLEQVVFGLAPGEVSAPVQTAGGWVVARRER